jgi:hypothetical protein
MFKVSKSGHPAIQAVRQQTTKTEPIDLKRNLGTTSKSGTRVGTKPISKGFESTSNTSMRVTGSPNTNISGNAITIDVDPMLTGMTPQTESVLHSVYRDIYYNDSVAGSAVDLMSMLPFGEFNLGGFPSVKGDTKKISEIYLETIERLNFRTLIPEIAVDYLVLGEHCSSLLYNREKKIFTDILPHQADDLTVESLPFYSQQPIITVKFPDQLKEILGRDTPRIKRIKEHLGHEIIDKILEGSIELDPLSTIYVPRRTFSRSDRGTSYFRRILPIYLIEKNLFRGTLVESARRQRGILHLSLGDGDQWIPSVQDMEFMTELFMNADSDPIGAIIATRSGVMVEELRQGGDFWKSTDFADSVLSHKLRGLGISEGFLSGDANYDTSGNAITVFLDMIRSFRETMTRKLFYDTLFPLISLINGFTVKNGRVNINPNLMNQVDSEQALMQMNDGSKLFIPSVHWTKQLKAEGDTAYIDMLDSLTQKGVPVPLRALAAAGGLDLETLIRQQDEDLDIRKRISEYMKKITALNPAPAGGEGGEESESAERALLALASPVRAGSRSAVLGANGARPLLDRDFTGHEPYAFTKTGKRKHVVNRNTFESKANETIIKAIKNLNKKGMK